MTTPVTLANSACVLGSGSFLLRGGVVLVFCQGALAGLDFGAADEIIAEERSSENGKLWLILSPALCLSANWLEQFPSQAP